MQPSHAQNSLYNNSKTHHLNLSEYYGLFALSNRAYVLNALIIPRV